MYRFAEGLRLEGDAAPQLPPADRRPTAKEREQALARLEYALSDEDRSSEYRELLEVTRAAWEVVAVQDAPSVAVEREEEMSA